MSKHEEEEEQRDKKKLLQQQQQKWQPFSLGLGFRVFVPGRFLFFKNEETCSNDNCFGGVADIFSTQVWLALFE
jgi:hypothetical protein